MYHNLDSVFITIFNIPIKWYAVCYVIGIIVASFYTNILCKNYKIKVDVDACLVYIVISSVICARLFFCFFYYRQYYIIHPLDIFKIWHGGMSFHGALLGAILGAILVKTIHKVPLLLTLDLVSVGAPIVITMGRIGNFINGELYGRVTDSSLGIIFPNSDGLSRHPSQIYQALTEGALLGILMFLIFVSIYKSSPVRNGLIAGYFITLYSFIRFWVEFFREPDIQMGYIIYIFTYGQMLCVFGFIAGIILITNIRYK